MTDDQLGQLLHYILPKMSRWCCGQCANGTALLQIATDFNRRRRRRRKRRRKRRKRRRKRRNKRRKRRNKIRKRRNKRRKRRNKRGKKMRTRNIYPIKFRNH